ncbi:MULTISPECIES: carbohydrate ABC transporter permease [Streptomyces]|uniref:Carbohydrate ABC transporter membrane protein 2, CUT1 family n=1 Tax=Streptomyces misionensis TaxID=67331 RepID=A0A1H4MB89_9ACTN|nr:MULTISPECIES: carbohydrate ABC transporter permease [Streptomyces]SEB80350.1 carbohydrate ABC transporter membrane protein 2, CUT1 family [Streptomyces misionensis]SFY49783.1 Trehalose transport system permease protein SugB [Streptomyces sp. F-1]
MATTPHATGAVGRPKRRWGTTAVGLLILCVMLFPLYWMVNTALQPDSGLLEVDPVPHGLDLSGFSSALTEQGGHLLTSLVVALGAVVICLAFSAPAAYGLAQFRLRGARTVVFGTLITQMVPGIVIANALYSTYVDLGLVNSYFGLMLADASLGIPFAIVLMRSFMMAIPREVIEAAEVDGAGRMRTFVRVVLPMSRNSLITAGLFSFLYAWSDFMFALTLNTTDHVKPVTLGIYQYIGAHVGDWGSVMAASVLAAIPAAVLLVLAQKYIAAGITGGSVK